MNRRSVMLCTAAAAVFSAALSRARLEGTEGSHSLNSLFDAMLLPGAVPLELLDHLYPGS